ncbi:MAG: hypothetical protein R2710_04995 [Acidimicrobiales bacterium]
MTNTPPPWDPGSGDPVPPSFPPPGAAPPGSTPPGSVPPPATAYPPPGSPQSPQQQPPPYQQPGYQPPGYQQPGYQQPGPAFDAPEPQRRKRKIWPWVLGIFALFGLAIGGCSFVLYRAVKGPIDQANEFLAAVDAGDLDAAAAMASKDARCFGETAQRDLTDYFGNADITGYRLSSVNVSNTNGDSTGDVSGTIDIAGQPTAPIAFLMVKEGGDWKVCGINIEG